MRNVIRSVHDHIRMMVIHKLPTLMTEHVMGQATYRVRDTVWVVDDPILGPVIRHAMDDLWHQANKGA